MEPGSDIADLDAILGTGAGAGASGPGSGVEGYIEYSAGADGLFGAKGMTRKKSSRRGKVSTWSGLFLGIVALQVALVLWWGIAPWWNRTTPASDDLTGLYALLVALSAFSGAYFALDGVWSENTVAVGAAQAATTLASFLVGYDLGAHRLDDSSFPWPIMVLVLSQLASYVLAFIAARSFGWRTYRRVGADGRLSRAYKVYQTLVTLLKLDAFSQAALMAAGGWWFITGPAPNTALQSWIEAIAVAGALAWGFAGWRCVRAESSQGINLWAAAGIVVPSYVGYKVVDWHLHPLIGPSHAYVIAFSAVASVAVIVRIAAVSWGLMAKGNFGLGLKAAWGNQGPQSADDPYKFGVDDDLFDDDDLTGEGDFLIWGGVEQLR